jgi:hypothetical protein
VADPTRQALADLIDQFNRVWVRPTTWNEGQEDDHSAHIRDFWASERDLWTVNLLSLIRTWLLYPEDGPLAADETGLQSWAQNISMFKANMTAGAEIVERELLEALDGDGGDGQGT